MIITSITTLALNATLIAAPIYGVIKGIDYMYHTAMDKEKPVTVIKFTEWMR